MFDEQSNNPFSQEEIKDNNQEIPPMETEEVTVEDEKSEEKDVSLQNQLDELNNRYIRLAADFDNYRKRQAQEREHLLKYGAEETLKKLVGVLDTFERAQKSFETIDNCEKAKESFDVTYKQLLDALEKVGLQKIKTIGEEFDPNFHEAVMQTPSEEHKDREIIAELQAGYKLADRVIRPALVNVAVNEG